MSSKPSETIPATKRLAAIVIGSNSIRLMLAEASPDGSYRILSDEKQTTRLAQGLARSGRLARETVNQSLQALRRMKAVAEGYGVDRLRVIATSAVREAANRRRFIRRVRDRLGLRIKVISPSEEGRLSFRSAAHHFDLKHTDAVVVDIGGGSVELVFAAKGIVQEIYSLPLGAVRLTESFIHSDPVSKRDFARLKKRIGKCFEQTVGKPAVWPHIMIGAGGTFMALANISIRMRGESYANIGGYEMTRSEVRHILDYLKRQPVRDCRDVPGLNPDRADIIVAGLAVIERLMKLLQVNRLQVHDQGVRDGLILTMIGQAFGKEVQPTRNQPVDPLAEVQQFASSCGYEQKHSQHVAGLARQLFDQLCEPLELPSEERLILEAAAVLHEIGYLVSYKKHHQHGYHLIMHGHIRGLSPKQRELVANVARYHRRAPPRRRHENFARLAPAEQTTVRRLSAILRMADGLDRTHMQRVQALRCQVRKRKLLVTVTTDSVPDVDLWGARDKGKLFEKVFGLRLVFAWQPPAAGNGAAVAGDRVRRGRVNES